jgi:hypothetical protein
LPKLCTAASNPALSRSSCAPPPISSKPRLFNAFAMSFASFAGFANLATLL